MTRMSRIATLAVVLVVGAGAIGCGYWYLHPRSPESAHALEESDVYVRFDMEVFDIILEHYWQKATEADVAQLFQGALAQAAADPTIALPTPDRAGTAKMLAARISKTGDDARKPLVLEVATLALASLAPQGRSGILTDAQETKFRDQVANRDSSHDLYQDLGVAQGASPEEVAAAYEKKQQTLAASSSPAAQEALKQATYAKQVLMATTTKALYDQARIEPSLASEMPDTHTLYLDLRKVTPGSFAEFQQAVASLPADSPVDGLIIDLRGNIGGTLDFARYLTGLFIGPNQYAFDLYHRGDLEVQRTPLDVPAIPSLARLQHVVLLVNGMTQSTAELTSSIFQRARLGIVVGERTRGWGTVENTFPIKTDFGDGVHYAVLLVHSATIRPDGQSIENLGITPDIDTSLPDWQARLAGKEHSDRFARTVAKMLAR